MKLTPAEQHIAEQSERRDLTSICQRLARIEDRMTAVERRAAFAHKANDETMQHVESVKRSLEGAHESIERLMNRIAPDLLPKMPGSDWKILADEEATKTFTQDQMRRMARVGVLRITRTDRHLWVVDHSDGICSRWGATMLAEDIVNEIEEIEREARRPGAAKPFDFGAELRRTVDEANRDMATICGQEPQAVLNRESSYIRRAEEERPAQDAYNRRMSEILARVAADIERANAYYLLYDALQAERTLFGRIVPALSKLFSALGSPQRPGIMPPEGYDNAED